MAKKISQLTTITDVDNTVYVPVIKGELNLTDDYKITPANLIKAQYDLLRGMVVNETINRQTADNGIRSDIQDEADSRTNADNTLTANLNIEIDNRVNSYHYVEELVNTETANRIAGDTTLQNNINSEISNRIAADNTITNNLNTEINNRINGDINLQNNINTETTNRISADNLLATKISLNTEITNRTNADNTITNNLNTEINNRIIGDVLVRQNNWYENIYVSNFNYQPDMVYFTFEGSEVPLGNYDIQYPLGTTLLTMTVNSPYGQYYQFPTAEDCSRFLTTYDGQYIFMISSNKIPTTYLVPTDDTNYIKSTLIKNVNDVFEVTINKSNIEWENECVKINTTFRAFSEKRIINPKLTIETGSGTEELSPVIVYQAASDNTSVPGYYFLLKDSENRLSINYNFEKINLYYETVDDLVAKVDSTWKNLGGNVIGVDSSGYHSNTEEATFNIVYSDFTGEYIHTVSDPLVNGLLNGQYRPTYAKLKGADILNYPISMGALSASYYSTPNILTVGSHYNNTFARHDITTGATIFLETTVAVGAHRADTSDHTGASSYGYGVEFNEVSGRQEMNDTYGSGLGDLWHPTFYNVYQQSPACGIVTAKLRKIKDITGMDYMSIRLACRATASNNGVWNMYTGFGVIDVDAAVNYINTNYKSAEIIEVLAHKLDDAQGIDNRLSYNALLDNSPVSKKMIADLVARIEYLESLIPS